MSTGWGASLVLSKDVPAHPCLDRFERIVSLVGSSDSGNVLNDIHRIVDRVKSRAVVAPGVYDVKQMRQLIGEEKVGKLYEFVKLMKLTENLATVNKMPKPPPVKDFFSRFEPEGVLRDLGTGNGVKADDSGVETVGYEDVTPKAPDVLMTIKPVSQYNEDVKDNDVTSSFLSATSSFYDFAPVGDAMHVYPDIDYMLKHGLTEEKEDGLFHSGEYIDKRVCGGEAISPGYQAKVEFKKRRIKYKPKCYNDTLDPIKSIGARITNNSVWLDLEESSNVSYKYDGRRVSFRQFGKFAYLIDGLFTIKFEASAEETLDLDFEMLGTELILMRVVRLGPLRPYDTRQALDEFLAKVRLDIPGFTITAPEVFDPLVYARYLESGRVDGKTFRRHGSQYVLKHHMSLDFRTPVSEEQIRAHLADQGFCVSNIRLGPCHPVEEYVFKRNSSDRTVEVVFKRERPHNKRTDTYKDIDQINWPTTEEKPVGLEKQPPFHIDLSADHTTLEEMAV
uniref:Uncharacterized protein n=1 Tax=Ruian virus TaxID=2656660 RepID=A0A5P8PP39_9VIRU|nr:MAG: hypothetical protein [Ruian virus]